MKVQTKKGIAVLLVVIVVALWVWRFLAVNRYYEKIGVEKVFYQLDEPIELGENVVAYWISTEGYTLTFHNWALLCYEDVLKEFQISNEIVSQFTDKPEYVVIVPVTVYNEDNTEGALPLTDFTLHGIDWYTDWNAELMNVINSKGWDIYYTCAPGTSEEIYLVYNLRQLSKPDSRWESIAEESMWIHVTSYPTRIEVVLQ